MVFLAKILKMMQNKHSGVTIDPKTETYKRFKAREWETIEDKLKCLNIENEMPDAKETYPKDFIKQLKDHIREIIQTGKEVKMATLSRYINQ